MAITGHFESFGTISCTPSRQQQAVRAAIEPGISVPDALLLADVSQSTNRGSISTDGSWGTLCTSAKLCCYGGSGIHDQDLRGRLVAGEARLEIIGHNTRKLHLHGLSDHDIRELAGNAMSFSQCAIVLDGPAPTSCAEHRPTDRTDGQGNNRVVLQPAPRELAKPRPR